MFLRFERGKMSKTERGGDEAGTAGLESRVEREREFKYHRIGSPILRKR